MRRRTFYNYTKNSLPLAWHWVSVEVVWQRAGIGRLATWNTGRPLWSTNSNSPPAAPPTCIPCVSARVAPKRTFLINFVAATLALLLLHVTINAFTYCMITKRTDGQWGYYSMSGILLAHTQGISQRLRNSCSYFCSFEIGTFLLWMNIVP